MSRIGQYLIEQEESGQFSDTHLDDNDPYGCISEEFLKSIGMTPTSDVGRLVDAGLEALTSIPVFDDDISAPILTLGNEDFKDQVDRLWQKIKRWIKALIQWLDQTLDTAAISLAILKETIRQTQFELNLPNGTPNGSGTLSSRKHVAALSVRYRPLSDISQITSALTILQSTIARYYTYVDKDLRGNLTNVLSLLTTRSSDDPDLVSTLIKASPIKAVETMGLKEHTGGGGGYSSKQLLGNLRFVVRYPSHGLLRVTQFQNVTLLLDHAELSPKDIAPQIVIPRFNYVSSKQCLTRLMSMVNDLEKIVSSEGRKNHRKMISDIERAGDQLRLQLGQGNDEDIRQRLQMTQRLVTWATRPYRGVVTHTMRSIRGAVTMCRLNQQ